MKWILVNAAGAPGQEYSAADALRIPWAEINGISVEGPEEIRRRVTAPRAATIGLFALAFKKREKQAILVLETKNDDAFFEVDGFDSVELRAQLSGWTRYFELAAWTRDYKPPLGRGGGPTPPDDPFDRLRKLAALKAAGLVTEQEFEEKRVTLLSRI